MALSIYIILLQALALVFVTNAIPLVSSSVGESEAFAARQARQIVQETGMAVLYNGRLAISLLVLTVDLDASIQVLAL
jgi:hypothetical protein